MLKRLLLFLLLILLVGLTPSRAAAHPADMYAQDQAIQLMGTGLLIEWKILPGPFLADAAWAAADTNHDGAISEPEARAWVAPFLSGLTVSLDNRPLSPRIEAVHWPAAVEGLRTGEDAVSLTLQFNWPPALTGRHMLGIHNAHLEANSLNWFSLAASDGLAFALPAQNNGHLTLDIYNGGQPPGSTLTTWTSGTPNLPDFSSSLAGLAAGLTTPQPASPSGTAAPSRTAGSSTAQAVSLPGGATAVTSALTGLVRNVQLSPLFLVSAFLLSLALGSLHALTPGHGKALVAAYLVGSQGRTRDAVLLGGIVTLTHTGSVLLLGLFTLIASHYILPSLIVPWLELLSGLLVVLFGLNLLWQRLRHPRPPDHPHPHEHSHAPAGIAGLRLPAHHNQEQMQIVGPWQGSRPSPVGLETGDQAPAPPTFRGLRRPTGIHSRSLIALGVSGGLVPCPDAIAILLVAVAVNRVPFGMLLIGAFSLGLAAVLIAIGIAMVRGISVLGTLVRKGRRDWLRRFGVYAPVLSAVVVTGLGGGLTYSAWRSFQFTQAISSASVSGTATQPGPSARAQVAASTPPQSRLLYIASDASGRDQLFLLTEPGRVVSQLTQEPNGITGYSVSPNGRTILYTVYALDGGSSIWSIDADGSARHLVIDCPQAECDTPAWYPDGTRVAYERLQDSIDSTTIPRFSIWWLDLATGATRPVFQDAAFPSTAPQFSPDGQWLSYISAASNTLVAFDLKEARALSVALSTQAAIAETWSPDSRLLLYGDLSSTGNPPSVHTKIYAIASGQITDLGGGTGVIDFAAAWAPDGSWIAIDRNVPGSGPTGSSNQVWLVKPDGTQAHVLLDEMGASYSGLSWSPDARRLLYSRYTRGDSPAGTGRFDVCSVDIGTGQTTVLASGGDVARFLP